ncbi:MAG: flagellar FlbD family protein [Treponema sp.]|nr:flagellar FlbD family protein [Treponema sp.]MDE5776322.1 flagellar FlbD family protein [Treponemataceae bacterium]MBD5436664.1 flagellar FlbD family protein [Treponema sp.]MBD5437997.1 flagellar FlbD family protein [Treponema sp.]MBD5441394.1 flagellar FlbD family protein [Treponema sp.]
MIQVERLNGSSYFINPHMIESMECLPDLTITMLSGKKIVVRNSPEDVVNKIVEYRSRIGINGQES